MVKKYINEESLQIAMTEYEDLKEGRIAWRPDGKALGYVSKVYDNENSAGNPIRCFKTEQFML
ncbi:hypothetical protein [Streptococcus pantholopis]|uniref:Uncharacterized protein n=1 Tax=Streptococcus pantholopis TaxID=1811193 RepID=A0A172Q5S0_9STRE|nr:hypothetical protein [Streptococcus pantholopis]AND78775.1 hypothetical protein A0O21_01365 [Streptococcus pantholopis]